MRLPLRRRILIYSSGLLIALIAAMLALVNFQSERFVNERIASDLEQGMDRLNNAVNEHLEALQLTARLVASFPDLKALLGDTDTATIRDFLLSYQQENRRAEFLIVLDPAGRVVARTDTTAQTPLQDAIKHWVEPAMAGQPATGVLATETGIYHAASAPAAALGTVFGFVIAGSSIDKGFAGKLSDVTHNDVVIVGDRVLGASLPDERLPWKNRVEWAKALGPAGRSGINLGGESYAALSVLLGREGGPRPLAVILQSRTRALLPYVRIQYGLLVLGLLAAVAGIGGSALLADNVTAPVAKLVEGTTQVAAGNFDYQLDIRTGDEIGDLARSFNVMIQGLRERADMRKFVSQSTVDMIQARWQKKISGGERVVRTIFFSDMRGFTPMAESRAPEEVVRILNGCLSLQAERVKRYHGDVDKYVGDCVVALFAGADMELDAIRCAVEIHKAIESENRAHPEDYQVKLGIGIATGEVILGSVGSDDRLDYTAIGSQVNLAARLCAVAGPREVLMSESTYLRVADLVAAQRLDPIKVKGFSEPVPVYRMSVGAASEPTALTG
jgi:class 3 adenylate cyclase